MATIAKNGTSAGGTMPVKQSINNGLRFIKDRMFFIFLEINNLICLLYR